MFSVPKLLLLGAVLWLVWFAFRLIERRNRARKADQDETGQTGQQERGRKRGDSFVELTECKGCGAYVTAAGCDNADCPVNS